MAPKPPPAKSASARMQEALLAMRAEEGFNQRMQQPATESMYYDPGAPSTVNARQRARANYKQFCQIFYNEENEADMYAAKTLIDRVCRFMEGMARASSGMLHKNVQMATLTQTRQSLEWWIAVMTPTFSTFRTEFRARVSRHIHYIAVTQGLSTEHREKNNLGELELELFLNQIKLEQSGIPNFKQHYVAWVLAFITGARPGSFTVSSIYRKGAQMGGAASDTVPARSESHTLRWRDIDFFRMPEGIGCNLTFRFNKGYQDAHSKKHILAKREWLFVPKKKDCYLDLSVLLFLLAYERGLFVDSLDELLNGDRRMIKKNAVVDSQAVFVAADPDGNIIPEQDMGYNSLNPKLQEMCRSVGLFDHNSMYSFRREAASVTKLSKGLSSAQELLNHVPSNHISYVHYDPRGFGRRDSTAFRLGGLEMSNEDIRKYFAQATSAWTPSANEKSATAEISSRVKERLLNHEEYSELENTLEGILIEAHELLQSMGQIAGDELYGYTARNVARYKGLMQDEGIRTRPEVAELLEKLNRHLAHRKTRRRDIKATLVKGVTKPMQLEFNEQQKVSGPAASKARATVFEHEDEEDEELDVAETAGDSEEAETFRSLDEGQTLVVADDDDVDDETEHDGNIRAAFIKEWLQLRGSDVQRSKLKCYRCIADPTMPQEAKEKEWILVKYHTHLLSDVHSRRSQLQRAFKIMRKDMDKVQCPLCDKGYKAVNKFTLHVESTHPEELWLTEEPDDFEEEGSDGDDSFFDE